MNTMKSIRKPIQKKDRASFSPLRSTAELAEEFGVSIQGVGVVMAASGVNPVVVHRNSRTRTATYYNAADSRRAMRLHVASKAKQKEGVPG